MGAARSRARSCVRVRVGCALVSPRASGSGGLTLLAEIRGPGLRQPERRGTEGNVETRWL